MSDITPIVLPSPVDWDATSQKAKEHILKLETLLRPGTANYQYYSGALAEVCSEVRFEWRKTVAMEWLRRSVVPVQSLQRFFYEWLTYTPWPQEKEHQAGPSKYIVQWDYLINTAYGLLLANDTDFKQWFTTFLDLHGIWINSTASTETLEAWLQYRGSTEHPFNIDEYILPDPASPTGGFLSFNQFFLRNLKPGQRPVGELPIVSPCDSGVFYLHKENEGQQETPVYTLPGKSRDQFDLRDAVPGGYGEKLVGGPLLDMLLWFTDYHHFHAPVAGKVVAQSFFPGSYNYDFDDFDPFSSHETKPVAGSDSAGWYQKLAKHQRYVWVIETEDLGYVAMMAIGFWGVGSIINAVEDNTTLEKGQYMGHFGYGGSSIVLAFEPGRDLEFMVGNQPVNTPDHPLLVKVRENLGQRNRIL